MKNSYYVYVYLDQRKKGLWTFEDKVFNYQPFYVGKGNRNRIIMHLTPALLKVKSKKSSKIKAIINKTGEIPIHYKIYENLTEEESYLLETKIINHFGRIDNKTGILTNHTDGGRGQIGTKKVSKKGRISIYQYDLDGNFIKKWKYIKDAKKELNINGCNISTAIKRNGTAYGYIWSYNYIGEKTKSIIKYRMPIKHLNINQINIETKEIINTFATALDAEQKLKLRKGARNKILDCVNGKIKTYIGYEWTEK